MEYGLIGARLGHSYSKIIHEMLCGYKYDLCPLPTEEEARAFLTKRQFRAINVTIPYKKTVIPYCSICSLPSRPSIFSTSSSTGSPWVSQPAFLGTI